VDNSTHLVDDSAPVARQYSYELHEGEETLATGWLTSDDDVQPGDELVVAGLIARVAGIRWTNDAFRLLLEARCGSA
jgi:hypothetical protein